MQVCLVLRQHAVLSPCKRHRREQTDKVKLRTQPPSRWGLSTHPLTSRKRVVQDSSVPRRYISNRLNSNSSHGLQQEPLSPDLVCSCLPRLTSLVACSLHRIHSQLPSRTPFSLSFSSREVDSRYRTKGRHEPQLVVEAAAFHLVAALRTGLGIQ